MAKSAHDRMQALTKPWLVHVIPVDVVISLLDR